MGNFPWVYQAVFNATGDTEIIFIYLYSKKMDMRVQYVRILCVATVHCVYKSDS